MERARADLAGDSAGLLDFWTVYDESYDLISAKTEEALKEHPVLGPMMRAIPPEQRQRQALESRAKLKRAIDGDWQTYDADLQAQGMMYAKLGVGFSDWHDVVRALSRVLLPLLVERFLPEPARLTAAITATQAFLDHGMEVIAIAYIATKEASIREHKRQLATTLESIGDGVIATDTEGRIVRMNPVAASLTGWSAEEAKGRPLDEAFRVVDERSRTRLENPAAVVLRSGEVVEQTNHTALVSRDGREIPIANSAAPIKDSAGVVHGVVLVFRDQTEERKAANARAEAERARLRGIEIEARSRQVEAANRLKSEFLANMSHELRTPLNAIIGFAELIYDEEVKPDSPRFKEFVHHILNSGRHLLKLINDVLDLSKVEAGKLDFWPEAVAPAEILTEVTNILRTTAAQRRVYVKTHVDERLTEIVVDPARFKQVLYNYLSNALKFTTEGGNVHVRLVANDEHTFTLEVEDDGIGIAPDDIDRLFVEFQQLEAGAAKRHGGTGLGLALTKRLVEAQGGVVGVTSTVGKGSCFRATLPRAVHPRANEHDVGRALAQDLGNASAATPAMNAPSVLVVDDDPKDRRFLADHLSRAGYQVETAATGEDAVARCRARRYDAVTLDLLLPDMSGLDVLRALRLEPGYADVPVIVVTVVAEAGVTAGFSVHDMLAKPVDPDALLASLVNAGVPPAEEGAVLVVDDDDKSLALMATTLERIGFRSICAADAESALACLAHTQPLAVILDLLLPGLSGFEFIDRFRQMEAHRLTPVLVWTVKDLSGEEIAMLRRHAQGIIGKGDGRRPVVDEIEAFLAPRRPLTKMKAGVS